MNFNLTFRCLDARRLGAVKTQVNINNNSTITSVTRDGDKLNVGFVFSSSFDPNIGIIRIEGDLTMEDAAENLDKVLKEWEASDRTRLPKEVAESVHNTILSNCIVEASLMARDVKLPMPVPLPQVNLKPDREYDTSYIR